MQTVFIVLADEQGSCTQQWSIGVFSKREEAEELRGKAQVRADEVHMKIRALGEDKGIPATWRDVCITKECRDRLEAHGPNYRAQFGELQKLKRELFPEDPDAEIGWDCTLHYTVEEWSVDSMKVIGHKRCRF